MASERKDAMEFEFWIPVFSGRGQSGSELIVVPGKVFTIVGGLAANKHVPVLKYLLFAQHLVLKTRTAIMTSVCTFL